MTTANQDNPLMNTIKYGGRPLLGLDLWEHSYYLKYRNKKDDYIKNFWSVVNWDFVNRLYSSKPKSTIKESFNKKNLLVEIESQGCNSKQVRQTIDLFNTNPQIKWKYRTLIDKVFKEIFKDYWREKQGEQLSGIYDFEYNGNVEGGRSVLNKINTNATTFCILKNDINVALKHYGHPPISFYGKSKNEQIKELYRFLKYITHWKDRLFKNTSNTFDAMYTAVNRRNKQGDKTENLAVKELQKVFGVSNVKKVGELGSVIDAIGGVDAIIRTDNGDKTVQIKPFRDYTVEDGKITMVGTGVIKQYKTDMLVFHNQRQRNNGI